MHTALESRATATATPEPSIHSESQSEPSAPLKPHPQQKETKILSASLHEWHEGLAHLSRTQIRKLHAAKLIHITKQPGKQGVCDICAQSKDVKSPSRDQPPVTSRPHERFHIDIVGGQQSLPLPSKGQYRCILIVTDDFSRYTWTWPLKLKSQAVGKLQWLLRSLKAQFPVFQPEVAYIHSNDAYE